MEERAAELGGTLEIASAEGEGTRVRLEVAA
jgi:signal transduction histidine kinase